MLTLPAGIHTLKMAALLAVAIEVCMQGNKSIELLTQHAKERAVCVSAILQCASQSRRRKVRVGTHGH